MSEQLQRLVYYSTNLITGPSDVVAAEIEKILASSRRNNPRNGISGVLMFNAGCFSQVLEGPTNAVVATFERIQKDKRHGDVCLLGMDPILQRSFSKWSMGYVGFSPGEMIKYGRPGDGTDLDMAKVNAETLYHTLHRLTMLHEVPPQ